MWNKEFGYIVKYTNDKAFAFKKGVRSIQLEYFSNGHWYSRIGNTEYVFYPNRKGLLLSKEINLKDSDLNKEQFLFDLKQLNS